VVEPGLIGIWITSGGVACHDHYIISFLFFCKYEIQKGGFFSTMSPLPFKMGISLDHLMI